MKKLIAITGFLLIAGTSFSQNNGCNMSWGNWQQVMTHVWGDVYIKIQRSTCSSSGICGWPKIALQHTYGQAVRISVTLEGIDCDDSPITMSFSTGGNEINPSVEYISQGNWHYFKRITECSKVEASFRKDGDYYRVVVDKKNNIYNVYKNNIPQ